MYLILNKSYASLWCLSKTVAKKEEVALFLEEACCSTKTHIIAVCALNNTHYLQQLHHRKQLPQAYVVFELSFQLLKLPVTSFYPILCFPLVQI